MWRTDFERQQVESIVTDPRDDWYSRPRCPCPSLPLVSFFTVPPWAALRCKLLLHHNVPMCGYQSNMKCDVFVRKEMCAMSCCRVARIIERTTKEHMALFPITREGHGRERLVSRKMAFCPATWRSSVQPGREGTNLDLEIVFRLLIQTLAFCCTICVRLYRCQG